MIELPLAERVARLDAKNGSEDLLRALAKYHVKYSRLTAYELVFYGKLARG